MKSIILLLFFTHGIISVVGFIGSVSNSRKNEGVIKLSFSKDVIGDSEDYNSLPRLYVGNGIPNVASRSDVLQKDRTFALSSDQSHYLSKVMRVFSKKRKSPPLVRAFDGINGEWLCEVVLPSQDISQGKKRNRSRDDSPLQAKCIKQLRVQTSSQMKPWLFFAPIKKQRAKIMVEKCTELGVDLFSPISTEYTDSSAIMACGVGNLDTGTFDEEDDPISILYGNSSSSKNKKNSETSEKLSMVALEAAEQSERLTVPKYVGTFVDNDEESDDVQTRSITEVTSLLSEWVLESRSVSDDAETSDYVVGLRGQHESRMLCICRERKEGSEGVLPILDAVEKASVTGKDVALVVGPEGGWSVDEESLFDTYCRLYPESITGVSLGSNVLRAETASILALGAVALWSSSSDGD